MFMFDQSFDVNIDDRAVSAPAEQIQAPKQGADLTYSWKLCYSFFTVAALLNPSQASKFA